MRRPPATSDSQRLGGAPEPPRRMDPRMRDRRRAVMREAGRRRLRLLGWVASSATAAAGAWLVVTSPLLDVDHVDVRGATRLTAAQVRKAAGVERGAALLLADRDAARRRVEGLSWVRSARVERLLPGTRKITVVERTPLAAAVLPDGSGYVLVSVDGEVLERRSERPQGLPELVGFDAPPGRGAWRAPSDALWVLEALGPTTRARVVSVAVPSDEIVLQLDDAVEVLLGPSTSLAEKVASLDAVLAQVRGRALDSVDVRIPAAPVVRGRVEGDAVDAQE